MKKFLWLISIISLLGFSGCGSSDSSKEARDLQQKILNVVGIPHDIIASVCQDDNENGVCESVELQAKVSFNRGDSLTDIWKKISETADGKYFLETYDATKPILLVLKDSTVKFDNGEFTLNFNGFKTDIKNEEKELSILESMVDADNIAPQDVVAIKKLDNPKAQEKFYSVLLDDLKTNINTLRTKGLDTQNSMKANIKEMADELLSSGIADELPSKINICGLDETCFTKEINKTSEALLITESEANEIVERQALVNQAPTVNAGEDKSAKVNEAITLTGTAKDSDGSIVSYEWKEGDKVLASTASFEYRATTVGTHTLLFSVIDNDGKKSVDSVIITVKEEAIDNNGGKRLSKVTEYDDTNVKTAESNFFYENDKLVKWTSDDNDESLTITFEYLANKTIATYDNDMYIETLYQNNIVSSWSFYYQKELTSTSKVVKYDKSNRPLEIELKGYYNGEESVLGKNTYTYDGNYLMNYTIESSANVSKYTFSYDKKHPCISTKDLMNADMMFLDGEEQCINWTTKKTTYSYNNEEYTDTQKITYNADGLPSRTDEYSYDEETQKTEHTYSIYEYK